MTEIGDFKALKEALQRMCDMLSAEKVPESVLFDSRMIAHELVTNALRYGGGRAYFSCEREGNEVRITVRGARVYRPPEKAPCAETTAEHGRGLFLVDQLSERRGYSEEEGISVFVKISAEP